MTTQALNSSDSEVIQVAKSRMSGGNGDDSYVKNSQLQAHIFNLCESVLYTALREMRDLPAPAPGVPALRIADLGCATGSNTLNAVKSILDVVKYRYQREDVEMPEVEVFFSDLPSNDFNTLFQELPPLHQGSTRSLKDFRRDSSRRIFSAGAVPGSFFKERLFPSRSMHIISSFSALHWLSEVPAAITDKFSDAYNENRIWFDGTSGPLRNVIAQQSADDFRKFLQFRGEELVPGGVLVLMFGGRLEQDRFRSEGDLANGVEQFQGLNEAGELLQQSFQDLVSEGMIEQEKLDTFNVPAYSRSLAEVRNVVEESRLFDIRLLDNVAKEDIVSAEEKKRRWPTRDAFGRSWANKARSVTSGLLHSHIGPELSELLFQRLEAIATRNYDKYSNITMCAIVAILVRRSDNFRASRRYVLARH